MRNNYEIEKLNPKPNHIAKKLKQQITINLNINTIEYFKNLSLDTGIPYQTLINLYLDECVTEGKTLKFTKKEAD